MTSNHTADVVVIGAGAAGMFAAIRAAQRGRDVLLLEKNSKPGVKILMSGGTRCNLTHATDRRGIADAFSRDQARFLRSPLASLGPDELVDLFNREGLRTKVESTGKVFPQSDRALDVQRTLIAKLKQSGTTLSLSEAVQGVEKTGDGFRVVTGNRVVKCPTLIVASGGKSYPGCGTTGDGYGWARLLGHTIVPPHPALVALKTSDAWSHELSGITLDDVLLTVAGSQGSSSHSVRRGALLLTHFGLSGPTAMNVSRILTAQPSAVGLQLDCDLLPKMTEQQILDELATLDGRKQVANLVAEWLPKRFVDALLEQSQIPAQRTQAELSRIERRRLVQQLKRCRFRPYGSMGFAKAEVTAGGIELQEVDSRDMQSRITPGLYLVGEVLDIDGPIGGYNFQAAFSTGWLAGSSV